MNEQAQPPKNNGKAQILQMLASSPDKMVQLGTLALVAISGVTNTIQTNHLSDQAIEARDKAVRQINILYNRIEEFEERQLKMMQSDREVSESNAKQIANQTKILENEQETLRLLHEEREIDIKRVLNDVDSIKKKLWGTDHP